MINGVSPNVVHSVDSAALHLTTCRANDLGIWDFSMIHDSYSTHATKTALLNETLRDVFVELFSVDILADWLHQQMEAHPRIDFPALPSYGDADINAIKHSKYFFS
jgi:DNA-directed RNA polymerase